MEGHLGSLLEEKEFPSCVEPLMANILPSKNLRTVGLCTLTTKVSSPSSCWQWLTLTTNYSGSTLVPGGASSDAQIFNNSELKECMDDNSIGFPDAEVLPNDVRQKVPFFLVGDDAFELKEA